MCSQADLPASATVRLFFALVPTPEVRAELVALQGRLRAFGQGRWVPEQNLHLTLSFLGEVSMERVAALRAIAVPSDGAFTLTLGVVERNARSGIVWLTIRDAPLPLLRLADDLAGAVRALGVRIDPRPLRPHVTLARDVRTWSPNDGAARPVSWNVTGFSLVSSTIGPSGSRYRSVRDWQL